MLTVIVGAGVPVDVIVYEYVDPVVAAVGAVLVIVGDVPVLDTIISNDCVASGETPLDAVTVIVPDTPTSAAAGVPEILSVPSKDNQDWLATGISTDITGVGEPVVIIV